MLSLHIKLVESSEIAIQNIYVLNNIETYNIIKDVNILKVEESNYSIKVYFSEDNSKFMLKQKII